MLYCVDCCCDVGGGAVVGVLWSCSGKKVCCCDKKVGWLLCGNFKGTPFSFEELDVAALSVRRDKQTESNCQMLSSSAIGAGSRPASSVLF